METIIPFLRPGDELVVARLDRLGRDTRDVLNLIHECEQRSAFVTVLDPMFQRAVRWGTSSSRYWAWWPQMERRFIKERQREGIQHAKALGRYAGGKRRIDRDQVRQMSREGLWGPLRLRNASDALACRFIVYSESRFGRSASGIREERQGTTSSLPLFAFQSICNGAQQLLVDIQRRGDDVHVGKLG